MQTIIGQNLLRPLIECKSTRQSSRDGNKALASLLGRFGCNTCGTHPWKGRRCGRIVESNARNVFRKKILARRQENKNLHTSSDEFDDDSPSSLVSLYSMSESASSSSNSYWLRVITSRHSPSFDSSSDLLSSLTLTTCAGATFDFFSSHGL